ncbi:MAG: hypothetical protein QG670_939 [Thermoproteota archaeon]|nr:hypothetical protein [Thermoproteota archaeon]
MDFGRNLSDSFDYSKGLFADVGRLIILMILSIIPIANLVVLGYMCKVIKEPLGSRALPQLNHYSSLWVQGLKVIVGIVIYLCVPIALMIPFILIMVSTWIPFPIQVPFGWLLAIPILIVGVLLSFFITIILAMAIIHMVKTDRFSKVFAFREILNIIGRIGWGTYIIWLIIIFILTVIVSSIGSTAGFGWLLSLIISPILGVFVSRSALITYSSGNLSETETTPVPSATPEGRYCTYCGTELSFEAVYCPKCGRKQ